MFRRQILDPLRRIVDRFPDRNAFLINDRYHTYEEFALHISRIRRALQMRTHASGNIGLVANDDIHAYASIFAIWLEGLAYVPLHPRQPMERGREIIGQAEIDLILDSSAAPMFGDIPTIETRGLAPTGIDLAPKIAPDDARAYILFTSGSTGKPKGVPITRGNLGSFMSAFREAGVCVDEQDRCLQCFDLTFDASVQSYLTPLTSGACAYTIPHDRIKFSYVYGLLTDYRITVSVLAPSMIRYLRPYFDELQLPEMRYTLLIGEASPLDLIAEWAECVPNARIINFYGPTEATIYCTSYEFMRNGANKHRNGMLAVGKPMRGTAAIVVDEMLNVLPANTIGELCVSSGQVTTGYWKDPAKNASSFFALGSGAEARRFYRTGDFGLIDDDQDIVLGGRLDLQVKINGYRIELGEIEYHARTCLGGRNAIAVAFTNGTGNSEIALFVEAPDADEAKLTSYLGSRMPLYMIPTKIMSVETFALNANGKVDRGALKDRLARDHG